MKKATLAMAVLSLALGSAQAAKITVWTHYGTAELKWLNDAAKAYAAKSGNTVDVVAVPFGDIRTKMINGASKGEGPDLVVSVPNDWLGEMAAAGVLEPMDKYITGSAKSDIEKVGLNAFTYKGKLFGVPLFAEAVGVVYNKKLVPKAPTTWAAFLKTAQTLTDPAKGTYGFMADLTNSYMNYGVISAYGGYIFKNNGGTLDTKDLGVGNAGAEKAMAFLNDLRYKYKLIPEGVDGQLAKSAFVDGQLGMFLTGPWDMGDIKKAKIDYGIMPFPTPPGAAGKWSPFVGVQGLIMNSYSKSKTEAAAFAKFLVDSNNVAEFNKAGGRIPLSKKAKKALASDPVVAGFGKTIAMGTPMPNVPEMGSVWGPWGNAVNLSTSKPSPDYGKILDAAVKEIKSNIK
ncbi:sugar ABC transporter substrate-binding protein [Deinococcus cellulosilyticus]|uniref:Maltose ABC transporter substrate-binding protein n=1 Tax=Deinococcus cellulosilyticus (strain DSM 18568 / NBRC 106333 / KACC 11606 / 5516J-15) TaxID=1223518 RepID=A0A511N2Q8_DEIC1|nr:maltose ABC transporter substrate-binding protein [Deinococcus cellulosilyticus]GEM47140.1 maltose ABC transporter substrate-binding protein [Deinococcus cellulosilyticus NBRC 106333 = KACC 11606]